MNPWQTFRQIKYLLEADVWTDGEAERVFGDVLVSAGTEADVFGSLRTPIALIGVGEADEWNGEPYVYTQSVPVQIIQRVGGDRFGQNALLGGPRTGGVGSSKGRGILEIEEEFLKAIGRLTPVEGMRVSCQWRSAARAGSVDGLGHVVMRNYRIAIPVTVERYYHPVANLSKSGDTVSWVNPPDRWDRLQIILRRASGSTPPSGPSDGTGVSLGSALDESVTDATTGTWTYAAWAAYDETGDGTADRYSEAGTDIPGTTLTVS